MKIILTENEVKKIIEEKFIDLAVQDKTIKNINKVIESLKVEIVGKKYYVSYIDE